jgi:ATP-dependent DNA helicase RecG
MIKFDFLSQPIEYAKGVGPVKGDTLKKECSVFSYQDLLNYYPYRYIDRSTFQKISDIREEGNFVQLMGTIIGIQIHGEKRRARLSALLQDQTGTIELVWFQGLKWISESLGQGKEYVVFGRVSQFNQRFNIAHPEIELLSDFQSNPREKYQPLYSSTEKMKVKGLDSRGLARIVKGLMPQLYNNVPDTLPEWLLKYAELIPRWEAYRYIHFPESEDLMEKAKFRLKYEELFLLQLHLISIRQTRKVTVSGIRFSIVGDFFNTFYHNNIPFELTSAQKRVMKEIRADMRSGRQMNRMLQGDVGSGKTLVALMASLIAIDNGYQAAFMVPTEILAYQHYRTILKFLSGLDIRTELLTGSTRMAERKKILEGLKSGEVHLLIGTHSLIEETVAFSKLGFAVIDEQHRFGVEQRAKLWKRGDTSPHVLVMTATPIPRTLAMTLYGDLDYSVLDEMPPGRKPVKTLHYFDAKRNLVFDFMKAQIAMGRQIYVVYPLIEESEKLDLKDLTDGYESITRAFPLPQYAVSIVHGRMLPEAKDFEMSRFVKGETQIMVSTTVIEVGVDVPNASVMVIESAQRFGLSQLHQLRGRVGRGADQSYCLLMTDYELSAEAKKRIATMVETNDGFKIADVDLSLRGPGDLYGTRQSGLPDLKIADLAKDDKILKAARELAEKIIHNDPGLNHPANQILKMALRDKFSDGPTYAVVG